VKTLGLFSLLGLAMMQQLTWEDGAQERCTLIASMADMEYQ